MTLLRKVPLFANLKDEDKVCIEGTEEWRLPAGEMLIKEGEPARHFFALLEGEISVWKKHAGQDIVVVRNRPGAFFGEIPLLLGTPYMLSALAESDCRLIVFPEQEFWKLLRLCPAISTEIFRAVLTRLRNIEGSAQQQEKLEALGTMSAGLAHELNNPSSAAQRTAVHLGEVMQAIQSVAHSLQHSLEREHWDRLIALLTEALLVSPSAGERYHSIEQSDSEDALAAWLRGKGVPDAWKIAPVFVGAGLETRALDVLRDFLPRDAFGDAVRWIALQMKLETLLHDAEQSTGRIASLVEAVRSIAQQERAEAADIDVHEQLRSALGVLDHKLKNTRVSQSFSGECGSVRGYPSELAQVWVNLLDNAADAVGDGGEITIQTRRDDNQTVVEIIDNGPGILPENRSHIFEPFFTTKGVGSGKGLGLTISQSIVGDRHGGEIEVESKARETRFIVRLPVRRIERNEAVEAIAANRAYIAELTEQLAEMESRPSSQTPSVSGGFATIFDVPLFAQLDGSQRTCFATGTEIHFSAGETLLRDGDPADAFYVMLEGELRATKYYGDQEILLGEVVPGEFFGEIEILLGIPNWVLIRGVADSRLFRLPCAGFWDLLRCSPSVARDIMRTLATRLRNLEGFAQEREKLVQLGAMAAGLAHELNNPATAARRAAADLRQSVVKVQEYARALSETLGVDQWRQLVTASQEAGHCATSQPKLTPLEQSDREEAIESWLDSSGIADSWDLAPALVNARIDQETLEALKRIVPAQDLAHAIRWLAANATTGDLLKSITHSTERISELVRAVKSYSFLDRAPWQEIDVHEGIENTLIILGHKLRNVTVTRDYDRTLPRLCAYGGELNQVWTNLIDNAIYAVNGTGRIDVRTRRDGEFFLVEIADNGGGIPPEARPLIFAVPFVTTKGRSGTGLGLVITHRVVVERHHGKIDFSTGPGGTQFNVRLPFETLAPI